MEIKARTRRIVDRELHHVHTYPIHSGLIIAVIIVEIVLIIGRNI